MLAHFISNSTRSCGISWKMHSIFDMFKFYADRSAFTWELLPAYFSLPQILYKYINVTLGWEGVGESKVAASQLLARWPQHILRHI